MKKIILLRQTYLGIVLFFFQLSVDGMFMYHHLTRNKFFYELRKRFSDMNCFCCLLFGVFVYILNEFKKKSQAGYSSGH